MIKYTSLDQRGILDNCDTRKLDVFCPLLRGNINLEETLHQSFLEFLPKMQKLSKIGRKLFPAMPIILHLDFIIIITTADSAYTDHL